MVTANVNSSDSTSSTDSSNATISSTKADKSTSTSLGVDDFLKLLVTQMQYQDPLEPSDNTQYIAQMATFTQVQATTDAKAKVEESMASNLVGQNVIMKTNLTTSGYTAGKVDCWENIDGTIYLGIGGKMYDLADLDTVMDADYYKKYSGQSTTDTGTGTTGTGTTGTGTSGKTTSTT